MPDFRLGRPHLDLNVVAQPGEAVHQLTLGKIAEVAAHHVGNFGLRDAHQLGGCWRRFKIEPPCRLNFEPGLMANL